MLEVIDDVEASAAWAANKLERKSSWLELRAICRFMDNLMSGDWLSKMKLPTELNAVSSRCPSPTHWVEGQGFVVDCPDGTVRPVIPAEWDANSVFVWGQLVDRCAVTVSWVSFLMDDPMDLLMGVAWGISHDGWNAVRNAAKGISSGSLWKSIVRLSAIGNFPHGPYRSGSWGKLLQETHARLVPILEANPKRFDDAVSRQMQLEPQRKMTRTQWWLYFCSLPLCCGNAPTILKFSRWYSANQQWQDLRPQFWLVHLVFEEVALDVDAAASLGDATSLWDSDGTATAKGGRVVTTVTYFTWELCRALDAYVLGSSELSTSHRMRTKSHLSLADHCEDIQDRAQGGWADEAQRCLDKALCSPDRNMLECAVPPSPYGDVKSHEADRLYQFTVGCISGWMARTIPLSSSLPESAAVCLVAGSELACIEMLSAQCSALHALEKLAKKSEFAAELLQDVFFVRQPLNRLILFSAAAEEPQKKWANTRSLVQRAVSRLPDEQIPENCHQAVRDFQRQQRRKHIGVSAIFDQCLQSGQLERRGITCPEVPSTEIAEQRFKRQSVSSRTHKDRVPHFWPKAWNKLMDTRKSWTSLTVPSSLSASLSWLTALKAFEGHKEAQIGHSWFSRLLKSGQTWKRGDDVWLVLCTGKFAAIGVQLQRHGPHSHCFFNVFPPDAQMMDHLILVEDIDAWTYVSCSGAREQFHIVLHEDFSDEKDIPCMGFNPLQHALWNKRAFRDSEVKHCLHHLGASYITADSLRKNTHAMIRLAFPVKSQLAYVMELYEKCPLAYNPGDEDEEDPQVTLDNETMQLIDELAADEVDNCKDLRQFKGELSQARLKQLALDRDKARAEHRSAAVKRRQRKIAKKATTGGKTLKKLRKKRKAPAAAPAPDAEPAPPAQRPRKASAPAPAPAEPAPPEPAPAVRQDSDVPAGAKPPVGGKHEWKCFPLNGGWIRYTASLKRCDAHCRWHGSNACKMDRQLGRGTLGLSAAWLRAGKDISFDEHQMWKEICSGEDSFESRNTERKLLLTRSKKDAAVAEVLALEAEARGGESDEPQSIPCKPMLGRQNSS